MGNKQSNQTTKWYAVAFMAIALVLVLFINSDCDSTTSAVTHEGLQHITPPVPDSLRFCGEQVPLEYFDVYESLERELLVNTYYHSQTIVLIKKANRYFPIIEPILKEYGIPDDFKYLAVAESGLANVVSPAKAVGFWQLLEGTAKDYGLEVNAEVDERYHLEKATRAACDFLNDSYDKYTNWTLTAASYNVGRRGVDRQVERQKETDYYNLLFNEETARYVYRIMALKLVIENPQKYFFFIDESEMYGLIEYKELTVNSSVLSWAEFAKEHNTNYKILKYLNPWLRDKQLINKAQKEYTVLVPKKNTRLR